MNVESKTTIELTKDEAITLKKVLERVQRQIGISSSKPEQEEVEFCEKLKNEL